MRLASYNHLIQLLSLWTLLCLLCLFKGNVTSNELTKFTDAMAITHPDWIRNFFPHSIDISIKRQYLFQLLAYPILSSFGFLELSLLGRFLSFGLLAFGLTQISKSLQIGNVCLCLAVITFFNQQSVVAGEWIISGFEPKVLSYGLVLMAIGWALEPQSSLPRIFLVLGLACSLHILVGAYASFAIIGALLLQESFRLEIARHWLSCLAFYLFGASFAIWCAINFLFESTSAIEPTELSNSAIYVFFRTAHHLDPRTWQSWWWISGIAYVFTFYLLIHILAKYSGKQSNPALKTINYVMLLSLFPFLLGLIIVHFDHQGKLMQLYLFRFADVMLPLFVCLLAGTLLQRVSQRSNLVFGGIFILLVFVVGVYCTKLTKQIRNLAKFPGPEQKISAEWLQLTDWARTQSINDELFIAPPFGSESFPWLARRRMLGTFKQVALSGGLQEWYQRMSDLAKQKTWPLRGKVSSSWFNQRYSLLSKKDILSLMQKYKAAYFVTRVGHHVSLPIAYQNSKYIVYKELAIPVREL